VVAHSDLGCQEKGMSQSLLEKQNDLIEEINEFENWKDKFNFIIDLGKDYQPEFKEEWKTEENRITGCVSQVWLIAKVKDHKIYFTADSDSIFVKGLVSLVVEMYSGAEAQEILSTPPRFLEETGLLQNLTPSRGNGVASMIAKVMELAKNTDE
tara:strand:- start:3826 stop:4287 length:462 start_codon:yes stop_codon:yes gene_type:complete